MISVSWACILCEMYKNIEILIQISVISLKMANDGEFKMKHEQNQSDKLINEKSKMRKTATKRH